VPPGCGEQSGAGRSLSGVIRVDDAEAGPVRMPGDGPSLLSKPAQRPGLHAGHNPGSSLRISAAGGVDPGVVGDSCRDGGLRRGVVSCQGGALAPWPLKMIGPWPLPCWGLAANGPGRGGGTCCTNPARAASDSALLGRVTPRFHRPEPAGRPGESSRPGIHVQHGWGWRPAPLRPTGSL